VTETARHRRTVAVPIRPATTASTPPPRPRPPRRRARDAAQDATALRAWAARCCPGTPAHARCARAHADDPLARRRPRPSRRPGPRRQAPVACPAAPPTTPVANPRRRMRFLTVASLFVLSVFGAQLVQHPGLRRARRGRGGPEQARRRTQIIPAMRGRILAADGTVLAASAVREVVVADQQAVCTFGTKKNTCNPETVGAGRAAGRDRARTAARHHGGRARAEAHREQALRHPQQATSPR
jgi:hypothetical protein